ncbi:unnamed protein product, partial [Medioppia subpectinata]
MYENKLIVFFFLVHCVSQVFSGCDLSEGDACGMKGSFFGNRNVLIPTSEAEMDTHCSTIRDSIKCLQDFTNNCLKGFVQAAIKMAVGNADKHLMKRCDNPDDRKEFLKHVSCLKDKQKMEPMHICAEKNAVMMETLMNVDLADRIPAGCCIFHSFQDCIRQNMKTQCGDDAKDYWDEVINEIAEDSVSYTCSNFESVAKCDKELNPTVWSDLKGTGGNSLLTDLALVTKVNKVVVPSVTLAGAAGISIQNEANDEMTIKT